MNTKTVPVQLVQAGCTNAGITNDVGLGGFRDNIGAKSGFRI